LASDGAPIGGLPASFTGFGSSMIDILPSAGVAFPVLGLIFILITVIAWLVLRYTVFGEYVLATGGGNLEAARLSGVPVRAVTIAVFAICGGLAAFAGLLMTSRLHVGQPTAAQGLELDAIAAVVLGGTSLFGGRGSVVGTAVAVMLLQVLRNIFNLLGLGSFYQMAITGVIIVLAILLNRLIDHYAGRTWISTHELPRIKAVIFMDGLLLDTEGIYTQVTQLISDRYGGRAFDWHFKQNTIGLGAYDLASYIVRALELPISPERSWNCARR
jgi:ribose/xylose/arabinose/galactoside ABC-type transport system permease subunit